MATGGVPFRILADYHADEKIAPLFDGSQRAHRGRLRAMRMQASSRCWDRKPIAPMHPAIRQQTRTNLRLLFPDLVQPFFKREIIQRLQR